MRLLRQFIEQRTPIVNPVALHSQQTDVCRRTQQSRLQVLAKAVVDGQRDDQRRHSRGHSKDGNTRDDADERLAAFGPKIAGCDEEFEAHEKQPSALSCQSLVTADYSWRLANTLGTTAGTDLRYAR
jgi:hypothetical protein